MDRSNELGIKNVMRKFYRILPFALLLFFGAALTCAFAEPTKAQKEILDNGLTVLVHEMPNSTMVSVYALIKTGAATEGKFLGAGLSHALEHMLFKATKTKAVGEISAAVQAVGGTINAATSFDYTIFTVNVPAEHFDMALDIISDMMQNAVFNAEEFKKEREVIVGEMRLYRDDPDRYLSELIFRQEYQSHPYRHPIIGYESLFRQLTIGDLNEYYKMHYVPNNMIISVAGNVVAKDVFPKIEGSFRSFERAREHPRNLVPEPDQIAPLAYKETFPTEVARFSLLFPGVRLRDPDVYALDVLAQVLGQGASSLLYQKLYTKEKLVYNITSDNFTPQDRGVFEINASADPENIEAATESILGELRRIKKYGIDSEDLQKAKQLVISGQVFAQQTTSSVAYSQALDEAFVGDPDFSDEYVHMVGRLTNSEIITAANRYFDESKLTKVFLYPELPAKEVLPEEKKIRARAQIRKVTLPNGVRVLLREDHTLPVVSIRLNLKGGTTQETETNNGIFSMLSQLWTKGTQSLSSSEIAQKIESLGASVGGFSGKNSFGLEMDCLSRNTGEMLTFLRELVISPTFPQDELDLLKKNMKVSLKLRDDNVSKLTAYHLKRLLFDKHAFRFDDVGSEESIERITQSDIKKLYDQYVIPNNMVLSVFGDIDSGKIEKDLTKTFGPLKAKDIAFRTVIDPPLILPREENIEQNKQQAVVMYGFHGPTVESPDVYGVKVLTSILGSPFSGRLFTKVREELGQAYTLGGYVIPGFGNGFVCFYVQTTNENVSKVMEIITREIRDIQVNGATPQEIADSKKYLMGTFRAGLETNSELSFIADLDELYGLGFDNYLKFDKSIDAVTSKDVQRFANEYLNLDKVAVVITRSSKVQ